MKEERRFLTQIDAEPKDRATRLVYADWLEERGDPRGELIRVEEEMRSVPIYADRYWKLKPRRRELRAAADKRWLKRMNYGNDYEPVFGDVPEGWKERWRLLREFTERWHGIPMDDVGEPVEEPRETRRYQGVNHFTGEMVETVEPPEIGEHLLASMPPSLREWIAFFRYLDNRRLPPSRSRRREPPLDLHRNYVYDFGDRVVFLEYSEPQFHYSVLKKHFQLLDPPVEVVDIEGWTGYQSQYPDPLLTVPRITTLAFRYLMAHSRADAGAFATEITSAKRLVRQLTGAFPVPSRFDDDLLFERRNMIALLSTDPCFYSDKLYLRVYARKPFSREEIPEFLWEYIHGAVGIFWRPTIEN
jgi:uncharacterized protein (TIGR02996 family)